MNDTQVDHSLCAAHGCNMLATRCTTTKGDGEWLCFIHVAADPQDRHIITLELNRLNWLVEVTKMIRATAGTQLWAKYESNIIKAINLAQRKDLLQKDNESPKHWGVRLEQVLADSCSAVINRTAEVQP